jgi:glyoxylase I family protein
VSPAPRPDLGPCPSESPFLGLHHIAFTTLDMDRTVRFYNAVLGLPIVATARARAESGAPTRRYFFDAGEGTTLLFVERRDADFAHPQPSGEREPPGRFRAVSLRVRHEGDLLAVQERLVQSGVAVSEIERREFWSRIRFTDPNGITVEAAYWHDGQYPPFEAAFRDAEPVPSLLERSLPDLTQS